MSEEYLKPPFSRPLTIDELTRMPDSSIDFSDIPETDESFWANATINLPKTTKNQITLRLDPDLLDWFKSQGAGYQSRINAVLRTYYEAQKKAD